MTCKVCDEDKSDEEFRLRDYGICISCVRERDRLRKSNNKTLTQEYYQQNKESIRLKQSKYWKDNNDELKSKTLNYYHKNKDIINHKKRQNHSSNRTRYVATRSAYIKSDRGRLIRYTNDRKRRALKLDALHPNHNKYIEQTLEETRRRLEKCLGIKFHLDHIIPLSKGGMHYHLNMQLLPATLNLRKGDKLTY